MLSRQDSLFRAIDKKNRKRYKRLGLYYERCPGCYKTFAGGLVYMIEVYNYHLMVCKRMAVRREAQNVQNSARRNRPG